MVWSIRYSLSYSLVPNIALGFKVRGCMIYAKCKRGSSIGGRNDDDGDHS